MTKYDPPTVTTVHESTGTVWTNKEAAGAAAYDTTTVTTPAGAPTATGSVTYSFYSNGTCTSGAGNPAWTDTVALSGGTCQLADHRGPRRGQLLSSRPPTAVTPTTPRRRGPASP